RSYRGYDSRGENGSGRESFQLAKSADPSAGKTRVGKIVCRIREKWYCSLRAGPVAPSRPIGGTPMTFSLEPVVLRLKRADTPFFRVARKVYLQRSLDRIRRVDFEGSYDWRRWYCWGQQRGDSRCSPPLRRCRVSSQGGQANRGARLDRRNENYFRRGRVRQNCKTLRRHTRS